MLNMQSVNTIYLPHNLIADIQATSTKAIRAAERLKSVMGFLSSDKEITSKRLVTLTGCSSSYIRGTIDKLDAQGVATKIKASGPNGGFRVSIKLKKGN